VAFALFVNPDRLITIHIYAVVTDSGVAAFTDFDAQSLLAQAHTH
jgi:hypothetical protein